MSNQIKFPTFNGKGEKLRQDELLTKLEMWQKYYRTQQFSQYSFFHNAFYLQITCTTELSLLEAFLNFYLHFKEELENVKAVNVCRTQEQENMSFTVRLTSLIFQQYKIGFKVELKNIKVTVQYNGRYKAYESVFSISGSANGATSIYGI